MPTGETLQALENNVLTAGTGQGFLDGYVVRKTLWIAAGQKVRPRPKGNRANNFFFNHSQVLNKIGTDCAPRAVH